MNSQSRLIVKAIAAIAIVILTGTACGSGQSPTSSAINQPATTANQALTITFKTLPDPPQSGDNTIEATVKQADGKPVTDATVSAIFRMPAMPSMNMPEMHSKTLLTHQGEGRYRGNGELVMAGTWNVTVTVSRGDQQIGSQRLTVIAK